VEIGDKVERVRCQNLVEAGSLLSENLHVVHGRPFTAFA
jgi:hypothetical protein